MTVTRIGCEGMTQVEWKDCACGCVLTSPCLCTYCSQRISCRRQSSILTLQQPPFPACHAACECSVTEHLSSCWHTLPGDGNEITCSECQLLLAGISN